MAQSTITQSKDAAAKAAQPGRMETLDGMRGIAAFAVILFHLTSLGLGTWNPRFAYLAVDIFFVLSGFVLAYAYDRRFAAGLTAWKFMLQRTRRLFPLYCLGLIGSAFVIPLSQHTGSGLRWLATFALHIPLLPGVIPPDLFPVNVPAWSLFFEFWVANLAFALCWRWLHGRRLFVLLGLSLAALILGCLRYHTVSLGGNYRTFVFGFPRTLFSFFAGVWIARLHQLQKPKLYLPRAVVIAVMLAALCAYSQAGVKLIQLLLVILVFPALVYFGAAAGKTHSPFMEWLGDASYAAYAIHWPILVALSALCFAHHWRVGLWQELAIAVLIMILAYGVHRFYDVPVRRWIGRKWPVTSR